MALEPCVGCGLPVWPENNPCDNCKEAVTKQAETPANSSPRPSKVQGATSRKKG